MGTRRRTSRRIAARWKRRTQAWQLTENGYRAGGHCGGPGGPRRRPDALAALRIQLEELKIMSPLDGVVEAMELQPGDLVCPVRPGPVAAG